MERITCSGILIERMTSSTGFDTCSRYSEFYQSDARAYTRSKTSTVSLVIGPQASKREWRHILVLLGEGERVNVRSQFLSPRHGLKQLRPQRNQKAQAPPRVSLPPCHVHLLTLHPTTIITENKTAKSMQGVNNLGL